MLKIAHASDVHLGYRATSVTDDIGVNIREKDGYEAFVTMITDIINHDVDVFVLAGDLFHTPSPSVRSIVVAQEQFRRLARAGIAVYCIAGNHDQNDISADIASSKVVDDPDRRIFSHVEPYTKHEISDGVFLHMISHHAYAQQGNTMSAVSPVAGAVNILTTHGSIIDPLMSLQLKTNMSPREVVIPDHVWQDYEWTCAMMGHIHERQWIGSDDPTVDSNDYRMFYNGSLIRRGFSDAECELGRGWTLWTIADDGSYTTETKMIAQRPQFDFEVLDASTLSSGEITEAVYENIYSTQTNGSQFDVATAPILRQKIVNLSGPKHIGMDISGIRKAAGHALSFDLSTTRAERSQAKGEDALSDSVKAESNGTLKMSNNIADTYDNWLKSTQSLNEVDKDIREAVKKKSEDFLKQGQEAVLEND